MRHRLLIPIAAGIAAAFLAAGCGSNSSGSDTTSAASGTTAATTTAAAGPIAVQASEMKFVLSAASAPAGKVTFDVKNVGTVKHEMVVIKTDTPAGDLPVTNGKVDESGSIGEVESDELGPGQSVSKAFKMKAGHYALICALPGHYEAGMHADFQVQ